MPGIPTPASPRPAPCGPRARASASSSWRTTAGTLVATAYVKPNYGGPARDTANAGFMVDPDHGGHGHGRALAEHVLTMAEQDGYRAMVFNAVVETNPAVRLWTSLGFTILGTVPEAYDHPRHGRVGLHVMHRAL